MTWASSSSWAKHSIFCKSPKITVIEAICINFPALFVLTLLQPMCPGSLGAYNYKIKLNSAIISGTVSTSSNHGFLISCKPSLLLDLSSGHIHFSFSMFLLMNLTSAISTANVHLSTGVANGMSLLNQARWGTKPNHLSILVLWTCWR